MGGFKELEAEIKLETTTGSMLTYKYKREDDGSVMIERTIDVSSENKVAETTVSNIKADGKALIGVAESFEKMSGLSRHSEA